MSNSHYVNTRALLHTYSHSPYVEGQQFIDQASARAGHHVNQHEVRAEKLPQILSIKERDEKYLIESVDGKKVVGGTLGKNYTSIISFLDKVPVKVIPNTNNEAYVITDYVGNVFKNFIDPSDAQISEVQPANGFEIRLFAADKTTPIPRNYGWEFDTFTGILHFSSRFKPGCSEWEAKNFGSPVIEAFIYIGKYTTDELTSRKDEIKETQDDLLTMQKGLLAIQPFKFTTDQMTKEGEPYVKEWTGIMGTQPEYYQLLSFTVPGYCFEITALDKEQTILTEMRHLTNGDTQIFMDLPWNIEYDKPIQYWEWDSGVPGSGNRIPSLGKYKFIATTFVRNDGRKIAVKDVIDCSAEGYENIQNGAYSYLETYERGWQVPPAGTALGSPNGEDININLNFKD